MITSNLADKDELVENLKLRIIILEKELKYLKENKSCLMLDAETQYEPLTLVDEFNIYKENNEKADISIADMIRETSETYLSNSGYSYDEKTGLYFHSQSGYYYDPTNMLFYDPKIGVYYSYDADTNEYKYHSRDNVEELVKLNNEMIWTQGYQHKAPQISDKSAIDDEGSNKQVPCIRLINELTADLEIITCSGGSIGSDRSKKHTIFVPQGDDQREISLTIDYDKCDCRYRIYRNEFDNAVDAGLLNKSAITKMPSPIDHHSKLVVNDQLYLIHVHDDHGTCDWCEPGQVKEKLSHYQHQTTDCQNNIEASSRSQSRRVVDQLKAAKSPAGFWRTPNPNNQSKYIDRSQIRRNKEKQEKTDLSKSKEGGNIGIKMMLKMGWNLNEPIGKTGTGITEPIEVYQRLNARAGIGCDEAVNVHIDHNDPKLTQKLKMRNALQRRYNALFSE